MLKADVWVTSMLKGSEEYTSLCLPYHIPKGFELAKLLYDHHKAIYIKKYQKP